MQSSIYLLRTERELRRVKKFLHFTPQSVVSHKRLINIFSNVTQSKSIKLQIIKKKHLEKENNVSKSAESKPRISDLNIQMLSDSLHKQIFRLDSNYLKNNPTIEDTQRSILHLQQNGLWGNKPSVSKDVNLKLPPLKGRNLEEHFSILGKIQSGSYKELVNTLIASTLPDPPSKFNYVKGWTKYYKDGKMEKVDYPQCSSLVFDIEVCVTEGKHPTLACAVSNKYWYSWCSPSFIDTKTGPVVPELMDLIPLSGAASNKNSKIIIGHNVSFDRLAVREQYYLEDSSVRFLDTMSLHIAVSGLVEQQRNILLKNKKAENKIRLPWMNVGCTNSLKDICKFYCGKELQKESRDIFVKGSMKDIRDNFQQLMHYCAQDVIATHGVLIKLFPLFLVRFPHPVTFAGMLEMGTAYLPVCNDWSKYKHLSEEKFIELNKILISELVQQTVEALKLKDGQFKSDPWLWDLDWNLPKGKVKKLENYPNWYRKLCMKTKKNQEVLEVPQSMSTGLKIVPKLLRLTWNGFPLHYERSHGWGYLEPNKDCISNEIDVEENSNDRSLFPFESLLEMTQTLKECKETESEKLLGVDIGIPNVIFYPLPHKNGEGNKVGNPLSKDFLQKLEDNTLSSAVNDVAELVLKTTKIISYWKNNRDRILSQTVIQLKEDDLPATVINSADYKKEEYYGAILPQVVTAGTITRRAVERTWMTASNAYSDRIGSELKAMISAPPGYHFVGADVDSQELWIASVLGDAYFSGQHGSTALGWMTLQGNKAEGTDMHSRTAQTAGISRDNAKVINYGRIYGAGLTFMQRLLKQFNPAVSEAETKQRAVKLLSSTKGERGSFLNEEGRQLSRTVQFEYRGQPLTRMELNSLLREGRKNEYFLSRRDVIDGTKSWAWVGGSESHMFNCLEAIARMEAPRTPVLGARITRALEPWSVDDQFMTSRVNWVVQSSAVDFLHLMLVCMKWLFSEYQIKGRFSISIHDEVRYLVASEDRYRAALAMQVTNLLTRSFIAMKLGLTDLPHAVAFFSGVDVDKVLRKEPDMDCVTPSNPHGLLQEYHVPKGETLDVYQLMEKTKGCLEKLEEGTSDKEE